MFQIDKIDYKLISFVAEKKREKLKKEKYRNAFNAVPREGTNVKFFSFTNHQSKAIDL